MKKYIGIVLVIIVFIIVEIKMKNLYFDSSNIADNDKIAEISKIIFQSILAGTITFLGLLFTIVAQGLQNDTKEKKQLCPCFIITTNRKASSTEMDKKEIANKAINVAKKAKSFRIQNCLLMNSKNNYALNTFILDSSNTKQYFENNVDHITTLSLALSAEGNGNFFIFFEDVCGNKFKQKIKYFINEDNNSYQFISKMPKGVNTNE